MIEKNFLAKRNKVKVISVKGMRDDAVEIWPHFFLTSTLDDQHLTLRPDRLISEGMNPG
jgi:hypothetical protein